jgi:hypothetical protein
MGFGWVDAVGLVEIIGQSAHFLRPLAPHPFTGRRPYGFSLRGRD